MPLKHVLKLEINNLENALTVLSMVSCMELLQGYPLSCTSVGPHKTPAKGLPKLVTALCWPPGSSCSSAYRAQRRPAGVQIEL